MRPQKVLDIEILEGLTKVFRANGYEGTSLKELSEATGLKKASLYHRFPEGKKEMAEAVLNHIGEWVYHNIFNVLLDQQLSPKQRLKDGLASIRALYNGGEEVCILRALSMQAGLELYDEQIQTSMREWLSVFEKLGLAFGFSISHSKELAMKSLVSIQGSLIVAKGLKDISVFDQALMEIEQNYIKA